MQPPVVSFEEVKKKFGEPGDGPSLFKTTELFLKQEVSRAVAMPEVNDWTVFTKAMKDFGQETQLLQQLTVKTTCPSLITEFVNEFEATHCFLGAKPVGFEFWLSEISNKNAPEIPFKKHMEAFKRFIEASMNTRRPLFKGQVRSEWEEIFNVCMKMGDNLIYPMGYTQEMKPPKGVSNNLGILKSLGFLKQAIMDNVVSMAKHCKQKYVIKKSFGMGSE